MNEVTMNAARSLWWQAELLMYLRNCNTTPQDKPLPDPPATGTPCDLVTMCMRISVVHDHLKEVDSELYARLSCAMDNCVSGDVEELVKKELREHSDGVRSLVLEAYLEISQELSSVTGTANTPTTRADIAKKVEGYVAKHTRTQYTTVCTAENNPPRSNRKG